jgi:hypothetical protein
LIDALPSISVISCASGGGGGGGGGNRNGENFGMESDSSSEEDVSGHTKVGSEEVVIMCDNECGGIGRESQ